MYTYPPIKSKLYPSINETLTALRQADEEDPRIRDVRPLMAILTRMSIASPRLAGHVLTRRTAISSFKWILSGEESRIEEITKRLRPSINKVLDYFINCPLFGAFCIELTWSSDLQKKEVVPSIAKVFKPIELEKNDDAVYILTEKGSGFDRKDVRTLEPNKYIFANDSSYWNGGVLRSIIFHELLRNDTLKEWSNFNKKLKGIIQGKADNNEKSDAAAALEGLASDNYAVTSKDVEFIFNELTSSKAVDSFEKFNKVIEDVEAIAILGQANTAELPSSGGSRAALQILNLIRNDILYSDLQKVKEIINSQLLTYDYRLNSDPNASSSEFEFDFVFDENEDIEINSRAIETAIRNNIPIVKTEAYSKLGLTVPKDDDELLEIEPSERFGL